jgi:pyruvate, water dikinase
MSILRGGRRRRPAEIGERLRAKYASFRRLLAANNEMLEQIAKLEGAVSAGTALPAAELRRIAAAMHERAGAMLEDLGVIAEGRYRALGANLERIAAAVDETLRTVRGTPVTRACLPLSEITRDLVDAVGGKVANLGEVHNAVGLPVPAGFAVTAFAYRSFIEGTGVQARLSERWAGVDWDDARSVRLAAARMQAAVLNAEIPHDVRESITLAAHDLYRQAPGRPRIALRSSAIGEDSHASFAGQYASYLNVPLEQVLRRWRETVASKFSSRALFYMHSKGFREDELAMSVGCFLMVEAAAAGVAYSADPTGAEPDAMVVTGVWGLGKPVVDGSLAPDLFRLPRSGGVRSVEVVVADKPWRLVASDPEGVRREPVPLDLRRRPCLTEAQTVQLGAYLRILESHFRGPQDVEWALDGQGRLLVLQTRPLQRVDVLDRGDLEAAALSCCTLLLAGGSTACPGVGHGRVVHAASDEDLEGFPRGVCSWRGRLPRASST